MPTQFGYEILRDHVLPSILSIHEGEILYWAGKDVARKFPIFHIDELPTFFTEAGWGNLTLEKTKKEEVFYSLDGNFSNLNTKERTFHLEAGFIAEQYQKLNGFLTECFPEIKQKNKSVAFQVKWDLKTPVND